jgi:hypothetical protein
MITFQFDECFSDQEVIDHCNDEGKSVAQALPLYLIGTKDPILLPLLLPLGNPIVTIDRRLPTEHIAHIPMTHPGIVVLGSPTGLRTDISPRERPEPYWRISRVVSRTG